MFAMAMFIDVYSCKVRTGQNDWISYNQAETSVKLNIEHAYGAQILRYTFSRSYIEHSIYF